jgi:hypothetical protein
VAQHSGRVALTTLGPTTEGRPLILAVIADPAFAAQAIYYNCLFA